MPDNGNFIKVIQVGGGGGGPFTVSADTPTVGQTTITDTGSGNSFVIPAPTAEVTGQFIGTGTTFAGLPTVDVLGDPASNGDFAILTADDGLNLSGIYAYDGTSYSFAVEIADTFQTVSPASQADVTAGVVNADEYVQADTLKVELDKKMGITPVADATALTALAATLAAGDEGLEYAYQADTDQFFSWDGTSFTEVGATTDNFISADLTSTEGRTHTFDDLMQIIGGGQKTLLSDDGTGRFTMVTANNGQATFKTQNTNGTNTAVGMFQASALPASAFARLQADDPVSGTTTKIEATGEALRVVTPGVDAATATVGQVLKLTDAANGGVEFQDEEPASDVYLSLSEWDSATGTGHTLVEEFKNGYQVATIGGTGNADFAFFTTQTPIVTERYGRFKIMKDTTATSGLAIRYGGAEGIVDVVVSPVDGTFVIDNSLAAGALNDPVVVETNESDATFEFIIRQPAPINASMTSTGWGLIPDHSVLPALTPDVSGVGSVSLVEYDLDYTYTPSASVLTTYIDSSAAPTVETLSASTVSGVVRLFTNQDVTNTATLAVQSGETLNGITDGTFLFSNYSEGTQFRADEVNGGWVVSVGGAPSNTDVPYARLEIEYDSAIAQGFVDPSTMSVAIGANQVIPSLIPLTRVRTSQGGMATTLSSSTDWLDNDTSNQSVSANTGSAITVPKTSTYIVRYNMPNVVDASIDNNDTPLLVISINGTEQHYTPHSGGAPLAGDLLLDLNTGDRVQMGFVVFDLDDVESVELAPTIDEDDANLPNTSNMVYGVLEVEEFVKQEVVLAGMVAPEPLEDITVALDGSNVATVSDGTYFRVPFDATRNSTGSLAFADGKVTLKANKKYKLSALIVTANEGELSFWDFTNDVALSDSFNNADNKNSRGAFSALVSPSTDIQVGVATRTAEQINDATNATFGTMIANGSASWMIVEEKPLATVVNPGDVPVDTLQRGFTELLVNTSYPATYADILTLILPAAGTYRVSAGISYNFDVNSTNRAQLALDGVLIPGTEKTLGGTDVAAGNWRDSTSTEKVVTVSGPTVLSLQAEGNTGGGANIIYASTDGNTTLAFEQLPTSTVVMPDSLDVEDVKVLLGSGAGLTSNSNVTISQTWGSLAAIYDEVEFEFVTTSGTLNIRQTERITTAGWTDSTRTVLNADDTTIVLRDMNTAGATANLFLSGTVTAGDVRVYGVKAQKSVINTTDATIIGWANFTPTMGNTGATPLAEGASVKKGRYRYVGLPAGKGTLDMTVSYRQTSAGTAG
ncbi:MAG: hypothetical protein AAGA31_09945, partial [Bacteroidota bacterium]